MTDKNAHTERLKSTGGDDRREATLLHLRMLAAEPDLRYRIKGHLGFGNILPSNAGRCVYADSAGGIYFNSDTGAVFARLGPDVAELVAGQSGPQDEITSV